MSVRKRRRVIDVADVAASTKKSESARLREAMREYRKTRDAAIEEMEARAKLLEDEPVKLSKGVRNSLYREVSESTKAKYRKKAYKPKKTSRYRKQLHQARKQIIEDALRGAGGNVARAARHLEIDPDTVYQAISAG